MESAFDYQFRLLQHELETTQQGIRNYDSITFIVKGWAITIFSGFLLFIADKQEALFLVPCAISVVLFWVLDALYKAIQRVYIRRYNAIEVYLRSPDFLQAMQTQSPIKFDTPRIGIGFSSPRQVLSMARMASVLLMPNTSLPYVTMLIVMVAIALLM